MTSMVTPGPENTHTHTHLRVGECPNLTWSNREQKKKFHHNFHLPVFAYPLVCAELEAADCLPLLRG